jgi:hypothetical protein
MYSSTPGDYDVAAMSQTPFPPGSRRNAQVSGVVITVSVGADQFRQRRINSPGESPPDRLLGALRGDETRDQRNRRQQERR